MNKPTQSLSALFKEAKYLFNIGKLKEAEKILVALKESSYSLESILLLLSQLHLQKQNLDQAISCLKELIAFVPKKIEHYDLLANIYSHCGMNQYACDCYYNFLLHAEGFAHVYFNYAYYLKLNQEFEKSIENYQYSLDKNIARPEEVYLNIAIIYAENLRKEEDAIKALEIAYKLNNSNVAVLFNLASLYEELGEKKQSRFYFDEVFKIEPNNYQVLVRLANSELCTSIDSPIIKKLRQASKVDHTDLSIKINVFYALGKVLNDCKHYDEAFSYYQKANELDITLSNKYCAEKQEELVNNNIMLFSEHWFSKMGTPSDAKPIFICGMFRSGSTLVEQILASHSKITAGGELNFFPKLVNDEFKSYPLNLIDKDIDFFHEIAEQYFTDLKAKFPKANLITDKRPDNFLYIGLIKTIFPKAKIIYTLRNPVDNCLSIYFQRLSESLTYATSLENIAHYYTEQTRLISHWKNLFPNSVTVIDYDNIVHQPEKYLKPLFSFLELEWQEECLNFYTLKNRVKTASIWQVRKPLYSESSGRWKKYKSHIEVLTTRFKDDEK